MYTVILTCLYSNLQKWNSFSNFLFVCLWGRGDHFLLQGEKLVSLCQGKARTNAILVLSSPIMFGFHFSTYSFYLLQCKRKCLVKCSKHPNSLNNFSWQEWWENFLLQSQLCVLTLIQCPFHPCVIGHSAKSAGGWLHLNKHTPLTCQSWSGLTMPLSRQSVGIYQEISSHTTRQETLGYSHLSSLSHCGLILAEKVELVCTS